MGRMETTKTLSDTLAQSEPDWRARWSVDRASGICLHHPTRLEFTVRTEGPMAKAQIRDRTRALALGMSSETGAILAAQATTLWIES